MIDFRRELMKELGRIPTEKEIGEHMVKVIGSHTKLQRNQKDFYLFNLRSEDPQCLAIRNQDIHRLMSVTMPLPRCETVSTEVT